MDDFEKQLLSQLNNQDIARVFPRKTNASPDDKLAFFDNPPRDSWFNEVHISVAFTYDIDKARDMFSAWKYHTNTIKIGGPAIDSTPPGVFIPGMYTKQGYVITSRGCPNNCWFCDVPKREGNTKELPITEGWNLLDSNILACSNSHIKAVFKMLKTQKQNGPIELTGGLEAARLTDYHVSLLWDLKPKQMFFAYDTEDDLEPLVEAGKKLRYANFTRCHLRAFVLIGYPKDTVECAEKRCLQAWNAGFMPMAMLWKNKSGDTDHKWRQFSRTWSRPPGTKARIKELYNKRIKE